MAMQAVVQTTPKIQLQCEDRRDFLGVLTAVAASVAASAILPSAAIAAGPDPIFPAIEAWREASRRHSEVCEGGDDDARHASCEAYHEAALQMAETVPTTLAGMAALVEIAVGDIVRGENFWQAVACASVARALRRATGGTPLEDVDAALLEHGGYFEPDDQPGLMEHFGATAPAPHVVLTLQEEASRGWCIKAEAPGHEPYLFGGYADTEDTALWAAQQVAKQTGATVREGGAP